MQAWSSYGVMWTTTRGTAVEVFVKDTAAQETLAVRTAG
jgi:hypothetical protein